MRYNAVILALFFCAAASHALESPAPKAIPKGSAVIKMFDKNMINNWAQCSWQKMPVTAQNLTDVWSSKKSQPKDTGIPFASPEENLVARLNFVCGSLLSVGDRNSISFGTRLAKKLAITEKRPAVPSSKDEPIKLFVCAQKFDGRYMMSEIELSKPKPKNKLPGATVDCFKVESDGSLTNA